MAIRYILQEDIVTEEMLGDIWIIDRGVCDRLGDIEDFICIGGSKDALILKLIAYAKFADAIYQF